MKTNNRHIILAAALLASAGTLPAAAQNQAPGMARALEVNEGGAEGFLTRAEMMAQEGNYRGTVDQLQHLMNMPAAPAQREKAEFLLARAAAHIPGMDAETLYRDFLQNYPASTMREQALLGVADCLYDAGDFGKALQAYYQVTAGALNDADAERLDYRTAYCLLKLSRYDEAGRIYDRLAYSGTYSSAARFYQGYIAYAQGDMEKALQLLKSVEHVADEPCNRAPYYLAQIYFSQKDFTKAAAEAKRLRSGSMPEEYAAETERILGESLYSLGDHSEGIAALRRYVQMTDTPVPSALYLLGVEEYNSGNYDKARQLLTPASEEMSALGQSALLYIGQSYLQQDNYDAASMVLQKACRLDFDAPTREMAYYNYAVSHLKGGRTPFGSSVALFEDFLRRYPDSPLAPKVQDYVVSGYVDDNNYAAALTALDQIKNPTTKQKEARQQVLYLLGSRELQAGDVNSAITHLREAKSLSRLNPKLGAEASLWLGESLYRKGEYKAADNEFTSYLKSGYAKGANEAVAYYDRGYGRFALKQFGGAIDDFRKFLKTAPSGISSAQRADALNRLADCQYYRHDFSAAAETYSQALDAAPESGDYPLYQQGMMKGLSGDNLAKIELLSEVIERYPSSTLIPSAMFETAESHSVLGNKSEALKSYTRLAELYPQSEQGRRGLLLSALTFLNMGDTQSAKTQYKKVISRYPTSEEARAAADDLKHISADEGSLADYSSFLASVPQAPKMDNAEAASLMLESARKALAEGRSSDALARATEIVNDYPDSPEAVGALEIKAGAEEAAGMAPRALETYRLMAEKASNSSDANTARLGIMRLCQDLGEYTEVISSADGLLASSAVGANVKAEATFAKALALSKTGSAAQAEELWRALAENPESLWGAKSLYYLAQQEFNDKKTKKAEEDVTRLIDANPPHDYWLARGFILLSDIRAREGNHFEAEEYLRSLRENYPGNEADILQMIDTRLSSLKSK